MAKTNKSGTPLSAKARAPKSVPGKVERRKERRDLTLSDQAFLNDFRSSFSRFSSDERSIGTKDFAKILKLDNAYLAKRIFTVFDRDKDGKVRRSDFYQTLIGLILGKEEEKLRFVFDIHDADADGKIQKAEMEKMVSAALKQSNLELRSGVKKDLTEVFFQSSKGGRPKTALDFADFKRLIAKNPHTKEQLIDSISYWFSPNQGEAKPKSNGLVKAFKFVFFVLPSLFWKNLLLLAYLGANAYFFTEAFLRYGEAGANLWVQIARGGGACLNYNGALILIPMMRNLITWFRKTFLGRILPVDENIEIHKLVGNVMFVFALVHTFAHIMNYLTLEGLFTDYLFGTWAGLTGFILLVVFLIMWVFAQNFVRRKGLFELFYLSHMFYIAWFVLAIMHGPVFWKWAGIPILGFALDLLITRVIKKKASFITKAKVYKTGVTELIIHRPEGFQYRPGDYLFLKIPKISGLEWHPFTISSGPEDKNNLSVHIRRLGNWTNKLYGTMKNTSSKDRQLPVMLNGPYGTPSNRIFDSKVAVLIGAGIGVTPFASIIRSLVARHRAGEIPDMKKVYFYWIYRGQKTFEWFGEMLKELEETIKDKFLQSQIYITDAPVNAATGIVKVGMELLLAKTGEDLLTGLRSPTKLGRPNWPKALENIALAHPKDKVNVFFCGPDPLAKAIKKESHRQGFRFRKEHF
jgi:predicted ferric reductase/Ca2+-binding EF-hand superfamily protein